VRPGKESPGRDQVSRPGQAARTGTFDFSFLPALRPRSRPLGSRPREDAGGSRSPSLDVARVLPGGRRRRAFNPQGGDRLPRVRPITDLVIGGGRRGPNSRLRALGLRRHGARAPGIQLRVPPAPGPGAPTNGAMVAALGASVVGPPAARPSTAWPWPRWTRLCRLTEVLVAARTSSCPLSLRMTNRESTATDGGGPGLTRFRTGTTTKLEGVSATPPAS